MCGAFFHCQDSTGRGGGVVTGTRWVETEDAAHQPTKTTQPPQQRIIWPQMAIVPRWRNCGPGWWDRDETVRSHGRSHGGVTLRASCPRSAELQRAHDEAKFQVSNVTM